MKQYFWILTLICCIAISSIYMYYNIRPITKYVYNSIGGQNKLNNHNEIKRLQEMINDVIIAIDSNDNNDINNYIQSNHNETKPIDHIYTDNDLKLLYCPIEKCAESIFKRLFISISLNEKNFIWYPHPHTMKKVHFTNDLNKHKQATNYKTFKGWNKFVIVRNPLERLLSGYLDKCIFHKNWHCKSYAKYTANFTIFANKIINDLNDGLQNEMDQHFKPQYAFCKLYESVNEYNYVIHYEYSFIADRTLNFLKEIDFENYFYYNHTMNMFEMDTNHITTKDKTMDLRKKVSFYGKYYDQNLAVKVAKAFRADFELFNMSLPAWFYKLPLKNPDITIPGKYMPNQATKTQKPVRKTQKHVRDILTIDGLQMDEFIAADSINCDHAYNGQNALIIDIFLLHSITEIHLIALRIYELCEFVDLFIISEFMYYTDGTPRNDSVFELYNDEILKMVANKCNNMTNKMIHHKIYKNIYVEGKLLGLSGETLVRKYFNEIARNHMINIAFQDCFKYFGAIRCDFNNMDNIFITLSDTDEIPRYSVMKLIKKCGNRLKTPISFAVEFLAYDFGCHLNTFFDRAQVVRLSQLSSDMRETEKLYEYFRGGTVASMTNHTKIQNGGWHLTYFGDSQDVIDKNLVRGHIMSRMGRNLNVDYAECIVECCGWTARTPKNTYRIQMVNKTQVYYPLMVQHFDKLKYVSTFIKKRIDVVPALYAKWLNFSNKYYNSTNKANPNEYCKTIIQ